MGGTKAGRAAIEPPSLAQTALAGDLEPLAVDIRKAQETAVTETLQTIKRIQTETRDRDGKIRRAKFKAGVLALRWEGFSPTETAKILGVSQGSVERALLQLRKDASLDEQIKRIDQLVVPLAVDNLARGVLKGDKEYTLRVLDGRGVLRSFKSVDQKIEKRNLTLHIKTELPPHHQDAIPTIQPNKVFGRPKTDETALTGESALQSAKTVGARALAAPVAVGRPSERDPERL